MELFNSTTSSLKYFFFFFKRGHYWKTWADAGTDFSFSCQEQFLSSVWAHDPLRTQWWVPVPVSYKSSRLQMDRWTCGQVLCGTGETLVSMLHRAYFFSPNSSQAFPWMIEVSQAVKQKDSFLKASFLTQLIQINPRHLQHLVR